MNYSYPQETLQEIPGEITIAISISGCNLDCKNCHSKETHDLEFGEFLTTTVIDNLINKYTTCFLFYGGEWLLDELEFFIDYVKTKNIKVALYTGRNLSFFSEEFIHKLDFIKVGPYIELKGNLRSKNTNQIFYEIKDKILINKTYLFKER